MTWKVFLASATGKYHLDSDAPCQDAAHYALAGASFVGAVCDGAGSASHGQQGAQFVAKTVVDAIAAGLQSGMTLHDGSADARGTLLRVIEAARAALAQAAHEQEIELRRFATTLVGCVSTDAGACFFHVGDGFAVHRSAGGDCVLSLPENGEYADETYFVTDENWQEHLRLTPLPPAGSGTLIGLMSDGTSPFAIDRGRTGFYGPFIDPVLHHLQGATAHDGSQALLGVLASERTYAITADDKTLLLALAA